MRYFAVLLFTGLQFAATVPDRYIVELSMEPVVEHVIGKSGITSGQRRISSLRSDEAQIHRSRVQSQHQEIRNRMPAGAVVLDEVDTVANAMFVQMTAEEAKQLAGSAGVRRILTVRTLHRVLDRAVSLTGIVDAWNQLPADSAGAGIKIGIIDTGIDISHPGFLDSSLAIPDGFPKLTSESDISFTNNKVIVARSYVNLLPRRDSDRSAQDRVGHGTALAMVAAGVRNAGPLATITGAAPKAWLGNYKVFGTPGVNDTTTDDAVLKALDDAVADGMDVINLSLGYDFAPRLDEDPDVAAIERATRAGVIVVVAAGNNGSQPGTVASPATAPSAIAVGASRNDRTFAASTTIQGVGVLVAVNAAGTQSSERVSGALVDAGLACDPLPPGSARGAITLILRGTCTFESKLSNAQVAGAIGAIVYAAESSPDPITMYVGASTLPAQMISFGDGTAARAAIGAEASMQFSAGSVPIDATRLASFSATGPNVDASIKPDLVAVGTDLYVATQTVDSRGDMYDPSGYVLVDGTSFSAPLVAGAAAVLKSARPGLTVDQYRSLLINSATALPGIVQRTGSGRLNLGTSLRATATAYPTSLSFGSGGGSPDIARSLKIANAGTAMGTWSILVEGSTALPVADLSTFSIAPGESIDLPLHWRASSLQDGSYEGSFRIVSSTGDEIRVPWWYGATSGRPAGITVLDAIDSARRGSLNRDAILFRVVDAAGLPVNADDLRVTVVSGDGSVESVASRDSEAPGLYSVHVVLGPAAGDNVFRIQAGEIYRDVTITGN